MTHTLANMFEKKHVCVIYCLDKHAVDRKAILPVLSPSVDVILGGTSSLTLQDVLIKYDIDVVINQSGHLRVPMKLLLEAKRNLPKVKIISVYHNKPGLESGGLHLKDFLNLKKAIRKCKSIYQMRYVYARTDIYGLLSAWFLEDFERYTLLTKPKKIRYFPNPKTVSLPVDWKKTEWTKEIIYVGRIDCRQKRIDRILDVWSLLYPKFSDWSLYIVGDGTDRCLMEKKASDMGLKNVFFEGFKNPEPYYRRASISLMTSDYEGFPMTVVESMSFGVVPVVGKSFLALNDMITDGFDGVMVPMETGFNPDIMAEKVACLMNDAVLLRKMSSNAIVSSRKFDVDVIANKWEEIFTHGS